MVETQKLKQSKMKIFILVIVIIAIVILAVCVHQFGFPQILPASSTPTPIGWGQFRLIMLKLV